MIYDLSYTERKHRAIQAEAPPMVLRPKLCVCGTPTTARQLAQHKKCAKCVLASTVASVLPEDLKRLQHTLGAVPDCLKRQWGLRNYFCAANGGNAFASMQRLVGAGLAFVGHEGGEQTYFHATRLGCKAIGLDAAAIRRALGEP